MQQKGEIKMLKSIGSIPVLKGKEAQKFMELVNNVKKPDKIQQDKIKRMLDIIKKIED